MIELSDIEKLAQLARLALTEDEKKSLQKDLESILGYVSELKNAPEPTTTGLEKQTHRNVMRSDDEAYEAGRFTEVLLGEAPDRDGNYLKVKKILG